MAALLETATSILRREVLFSSIPKNIRGIFQFRYASLLKLDGTSHTSPLVASIARSLNGVHPARPISSNASGVVVPYFEELYASHPKQDFQEVCSCNPIKIHTGIR